MMLFPTDSYSTQTGKVLEIYFLVHSSLIFKFGNRVIYVDPTCRLCDFSDFEKADFIFFTHHHSDHFDLAAIEQLSNEDTTIVCTKTVADAIPNRADLDIEIMNNWDSISFRKGMTVDAVPAYNYVMREQYHPQGRDNGYIFTFDGLKIYVAGDTEDVPAIHKLAEKAIDIAFLPVDQPYTMTVKQVCNAANIIKPKIFYPYHIGQSNEFTNLEQLSAAFAEKNIELKLRFQP